MLSLRVLSPVLPYVNIYCIYPSRSSIASHKSKTKFVFYSYVIRLCLFVFLLPVAVIVTPVMYLTRRCVWCALAPFEATYFSMYGRTSAKLRFIEHSVQYILSS
jgi:hypothetical protein